MTPCNIFGCVIDDENRYSSSSRAKKWNFTAVVVVVGHTYHTAAWYQVPFRGMSSVRARTSKRYLRYLRYL